MLKKMLLVIILVMTNLLGGDAIKFIGLDGFFVSPKIPLKIKFEQGIKKGDKIIVKVDNQQVFELVNNSKNPIKYIRTRIRIIDSSSDQHSVNIELIDKDGNRITASGDINGPYGYGGIRLHGEPTNKVKVKISKKHKNQVKFQVINEMNRINYIDMVKIQSSQGEIVIKTTPLLLKNLLFKIKAKNNFDKLNIITHISDKPYLVGLNSSMKNLLKSPKDKKVVLLAIKKDSDALIFADDSLRKDKEFVLAVVKKDGYALRYADDSLRKDKEVVLAAVKQNAEVLEYADDSLKKNKQFILTAIKENGRVLKYVDNSIKLDLVKKL